MKLSMRIGKFLAYQQLQRLSGRSETAEINNIRPELEILKRKILHLHPSQSEILNNGINETISDTREATEQRIERDYRPTNARLDEKAIVNLTTYQIPEDIMLGLSFGPKFVFPQRICLENILNIITSCSCSFEQNLPVTTSSEAYKQASIQLGQYTRKHIDDKEIWLLFLQYRIKKYLLDNKNLLVTRSDKGKHTVVVERDTYTAKMMELVSSDDYEILSGVDITTLETTNNILARQLFECGAIKDVSKISDHSTLFAQMYGLIKIHKNDFPVRPITSACGSPGFKLATFMSNILTILYPEMGFHVKNSLEVKCKLDHILFNEDEELVSFDVVSMFTNITIELMLSIIESRKDILMTSFGISWKFFSTLMNFLLRDCAIFSFNGTFFKQKGSLAMGSPLSPILAKILMNNIIDYTLSIYKKQPKLVSLYVDDSLWIIPKNDTKFILDTMNSFHERISFTMEKEKDGHINFLDIEVIRSDLSAITCWFKKPFASLRVLNWFSNHSHTCITQTAISFIKMVFRLSHDDFFLKNRDVLFEMLSVNSFPIDVAMRLMQENYSLMRPISYKTSRKTFKYAPIPYQPGFAGPLKTRMKSLHPGFLLTSVPDRSSTNHFSHLKDKVKAKFKTNMLLLLECRCKKYIDVRHTGFLERASTIIDFCNSNFDTGKGNCIRSLHKMNRWRFIRCKNYRVLTTKYQAFLHLHRHRLQFPVHSQLHLRFKKHLNDFAVGLPISK